MKLAMALAGETRTRRRFALLPAVLGKTILHRWTPQSKIWLEWFWEEKTLDSDGTWDTTRTWQ